MLADRIRAVGIVSAALLGVFAGVAMLATDDQATAAQVTVATVETVEAPVREVQYVVAPVRERTVYCRYPISRSGLAPSRIE